MSICWDVMPWAKGLGRQMDRLTFSQPAGQKWFRLADTPLSLGKKYETTQWNHMPLCDHSIPKHSTAKTWLCSLSQWWLKLKLLKCRDRLQKRRIFTSRIISLVAVCSTNALLSGKPCSSKFNYSHINIFMCGKWAVKGQQTGSGCSRERRPGSDVLVRKRENRFEMLLEMCCNI